MRKPRTASANRLGNRENNQDRCLIEQLPGISLLAVADGMGGHDRGDLAAQAAVDSLARTLRRQRLPLQDPAGFLKQALRSAHLDVVDAGCSHRPPITPRTTCVACVVQAGHAWWAHVGDSRLYLLRDGALFTRTRDHTPVEELRQSGLIGEAELRTHPLRNTVNRCLGGPPRFPEITLADAALEAGDLLLLCSDGLWSALPENRLLALTGEEELETALEQLCSEAEIASYPGSDNISAVALRWAGGRETMPGDEKPAAAKDSGTKEKDPLEEAIENIHRALLEYASEMKK
ncbi:MAG TPA: serine/threonine-protein phosphatase [Gammaproteobacteria bacterium]|nr:serine/threonine-protein phosphatase [Gammaproteobacteria bacterium]